MRLDNVDRKMYSPIVTIRETRNARTITDVYGTAGKSWGNKIMLKLVYGTWYKYMQMMLYGYRVAIQVSNINTKDWLSALFLLPPSSFLVEYYLKLYIELMTTCTHQFEISPKFVSHFLQIFWGLDAFPYSWCCKLHNLWWNAIDHFMKYTLLLHIISLRQAYSMADHARCQ